MIFLGLALPLSVLATDSDEFPVDPEDEPRWWAENPGEATVPFPYVYEPVGSWVYDEIQRQVTQGNLTGIHHNTRVLPRALIAARVARALSEGKRSLGLSRLAREFAWEGRMMGLELPYQDTRPMATLGSPESMGKFNGLLSVGGQFEKNEQPDFSNHSALGFRGTYWHPKGFSLSVDFIITQVENAARFGDPIFEDTDIQLNTPRFAATWHSRFFEVWFGRENLQWGPGRRGGLMVGGGSPPYVQLGYRLHLGTFIAATATHGWLSMAEHRFTASHRIELSLGKLRLGLGESVRYDANAPEPYYLINIIPYFAAERLLTADASEDADRNELFRSNFIVSTDLYWTITPGLAAYGEFMVDDIKRDNGLFDTSTESGVPVRIGYQIGGTFVREGTHRVSLQAEYSRVYNYTYATWYGRDFYQQGQSMGYPLGADASDLNLWVDYDLNVNWGLRGRAFSVRIGEGNNAGPWCPGSFLEDDPFPEVECQTYGQASGSEFAGVVAKRNGFELGAVFAPRDNLRFEATGGVAFMSNLAHVQGLDESRPIGRLLASWRW